VNNTPEEMLDALPLPFATVKDGSVQYEVCVPHCQQDFIQKFLNTEGKPYELEMLRDMAYRLSPGDLVLDVGAHVGNHTFYLANAAKAKIEAFEPNVELAAAMRETVEHCGLQDRVRVHAVGVGSRAAQAHFKNALPDNLGAQELELGDGEIPILTLDSLSFDEPVRLLKIDVEGMEFDVLEGAAALIQKDRPLLYIECRDERSLRNLSRWSAVNNYTWWEYFNATPTHLLRPVETADISERLGRLAAREAIQEYRYNSRLRQALKRQQAAERHVASTEAELARMKKAHADAVAVSASLRRSLVARQEKLGSVLGSHQELQGKFETLEHTIAELEESRLRADRSYRRNNQALRSAKDAAEARIREIEESTTHLLGEAIASAATSWRGLLSLPVSLSRLLFRGISRGRARRRGDAEGAELPEERVDAPDDFTPYALEWMDKNPSSRSALAILYADINVNVVDGSSVWLSSMASILCARGPCILISKANVERDVILSNVKNAQNLIVIEPTIVPGLDALDVEASARLIKTLDNLLPHIKALVVRGLDAANTLLRDRQFHGRCAAYLTDFFTIDNNRLITSDVQRSKLTTCVARAGKVLAQTTQIADEMKRLTNREIDFVHMPPVIPDGLSTVELRPAADGAPIKIGYAGKINSRWGIIELLDWAEQLIALDVPLELHIVADKITNGPDPGFENLRHTITSKMSDIGAKHYTGFNRSASMDLMAKMDFVWCYRPALLEENTLEFSTKLAEMVAVEARCICYPNVINQEALGSEYPYFVKSFDELRNLLMQSNWGSVPAASAERIRERHSLAKVISGVGERLISKDSADQPGPAKTVLFSGHDFKFVDAYVSHVKNRDVAVVRDAWHWSAVQNQDALMRLHKNADVVFCEWGLANAVWHSRNLRPDQRLVIRIHAQEVRERARRFGAAINVENVDKFIFVSDEIRDTALGMWGWPAEKTIVVPNYVLDKEFRFVERGAQSAVVLGMVGIVPRLKRLDRAIGLLERLVDAGVNASLRIKGHRPETLSFMHAPSRRPELDYYDEQYKRIAASELLTGRLHFDPWGNDIAEWYDRVDVILSCSETESFHYALADGVLTGCFPVVWPWRGADRTFDEGWVVNDVQEAAERIQGWSNLSGEQRIRSARQNRDMIVQRYGSDRIFSILDDLLLG
jgi:FkbM family methyltransferase